MGRRGRGAGREAISPAYLTARQGAAASANAIAQTRVARSRSGRARPLYQRARISAYCAANNRRQQTAARSDLYTLCLNALRACHTLGRGWWRLGGRADAPRGRRSGVRARCARRRNSCSCLGEIRRAWRKNGAFTPAATIPSPLFLSSAPRHGAYLYRGIAQHQCYIFHSLPPLAYVCCIACAQPLTRFSSLVLCLLLFHCALALSLALCYAFRQHYLFSLASSRLLPRAVTMACSSLYLLRLKRWFPRTVSVSYNRIPYLRFWNVAGLVDGVVHRTRHGGSGGRHRVTGAVRRQYAARISAF